MRVLVTGATGRLGRALLPRLAAAGHLVRAMSRQDRPALGGAEWIRADLTTGHGLKEAVDGVDAVVHLAAAPYRRGYTEQVEVAGTRRLAGAARDAGTGHLLYVSILGADRVPWGYFSTKVQGEAAVKAGEVPWSIVRAAQFHEFAEQAVRLLARTGVMVADPGVRAQPVDVRDVADRLATLLTGEATGHVENFGGPEILTFEQGVRQWLDIRGKRRPVLRLKLPGALGTAFRAGHLTTADQPSGKITWAHYLAGKYR
jgi:uncharacterized protein YbjT (DUF2867 family)